jgi:hypothetical protein
MKTKVIKQTITIKCDPHEVYETLMNSQKHSRLISAPLKSAGDQEVNFQYGMVMPQV